MKSSVGIVDAEQWARLNKQLLNTLPLENQYTIRYICAFLKLFAVNQDVHKMNVNNLAIVFGPNFMRPEEETIESAVKEMPVSTTFLCVLIQNAEEWIPKKPTT